MSDRESQQTIGRIIIEMTGSKRKWWDITGALAEKGAEGRPQARLGEDTPEKDGDVINRAKCTRHRFGGLLTGSSFPDSSVGKESACNAGDSGLVPGSGRSAWRRDSYPLQYSGLESSMFSIVHGVIESDSTE